MFPVVEMLNWRVSPWVIENVWVESVQPVETEMVQVIPVDAKLFGPIGDLISVTVRALVAVVAVSVVADMFLAVQVIGAGTNGG